MRRWFIAVCVLVGLPARPGWPNGQGAQAPPGAAGAIRCDDSSTADVALDGLLDDWKGNAVLARAGGVPDAAFELRCSWDGTALALALDVIDDRVVRVRSGKAHEDHVAISIAAGGRPVVIDAYPGNAIAKSRIAAPARIQVSDSLQPRGFSLEAVVPARALAGFSAATPSLALRVVFHDSDRATGGADHDVELATTIELGDRKDLLDDFLKETRLRRGDVKLDQLAELDPDRKGAERLVAGGTVIGVLTDRFAYVTLPVAHAADVREVKLLPLGPRGQQIISAVVRQGGNGGTRDLLMLWTVWSGQLEPLAQIEVRKEAGGNVLESTWAVSPARGRTPAELIVTPKPAIGWTAETWNEEPAGDADAIVLPWDGKRGGVAYSLRGKDIARRPLPPAKPRR